jgi:hypothetical protein
MSACLDDESFRRMSDFSSTNGAAARLLDFNETRGLKLRAEIIAHGELV